MRYIYQEPVITTISDDEITDDEAVKELLVKIKKMQYNIAIEFTDKDSDVVKSIEKARIMDIKEDTCDISGFFSQSSVKYRDIPFGYIRKIRVIASKTDISKKYRVNRWHLLDVAEVEGE